jgi:DNA-binding winged helix-turn-helix (wHTH) protein/TolB-like protein
MGKGLNNLREFGKFRLDTERKVLSFENRTVNLPLKEIELLCVLTASTELISKDELIDQVWQDSFVEESNLSRHIYRLRKMLAEYGESEDLIETVPKRGYRFTGEIRQISDSHDLIIEKHSITRTVIEEIDHAIEPNIKALPPKSPTNRFLIPVLACLVIFTVGFGYYFYSKTTPTDIKSVKTIAVLPLKIYKENSNDLTLPIRITDAVITQLGTSERIIVRPTSAVLVFTNDERDVLEIGNKLHTETVLDGRIQQENDRLRVTLQLINVADGKQLWSGQIDGIATQILLLQDEISHKVLEVLDPNHRKDSELAALPTKNSDAYEAYLQGRYLASQRTAEEMKKAAESFQKSVELDSNFAEAYAGLADTKFLLYDYSVSLEKSLIDSAKDDLNRALVLKPNLAEAFVTRGTIEESYDWDWESADKSLRKAIEFSPNNSLARYRYGAILLRLGRFDEARIHLEKAIELDPRSIVAYANLGMNFHCKKDYSTAEAYYRKILEISDKLSTPHWLLARTLWMAGKKDQAVREIVRALEFEGEAEIAHRLEKQSSADFAIKELLTEWEKNPTNTTPQYIAYFYSNLGDKEKALKRLEKNYNERITSITWLKSAPEFEILKDEPRYQVLLKKMNLQ